MNTKATMAVTRRFGTLLVSAEVHDGEDFFARRLVAVDSASDERFESPWTRTYESICELQVGERSFVSFSAYWTSSVIEAEVPLMLVCGTKVK